MIPLAPFTDGRIFVGALLFMTAVGLISAVVVNDAGVHRRQCEQPAVGAVVVDRLSGEPLVVRAVRDCSIYARTKDFRDVVLPAHELEGAR